MFSNPRSFISLESESGPLIQWLQALIAHQGYGVVFLVVFLNNICLPIPGDTTLLTAGFLSEKGILSPWFVIVSGTVACFMGANIAYALGAKYGRPLLENNRWLMITPKRFSKMELFFRQYGAKAVFFARFVGFLHPVTGLLAGIWKTPRTSFLIYNLAGSLAYVSTYTMAGFYFRQNLEVFKHGLGPIVLNIALVVVGLLILGLFLRRTLRAFFSEPSNVKPRAGFKARKS
jgi:membrane protein DedA with SNARE-associated domain